MAKINPPIYTYRRIKVVRVMGLEPIRQRHTPLKRACLPIPAYSHLAKIILAKKISNVKYKYSTTLC